MGKSMELGIADKAAVVCGAETDLGEACVHSLLAEGVRVWAVSGSDTGWATAQHKLSSKQQLNLHAVACDINTQKGRQEVLQACAAPDILINHAAGPPAGDFRHWSREDWLQALEQNMLTAVELIRLVMDGMIERGYGRILNVTSQSVKAPMANLDLSNAVRAGLTGFVAGVARMPRPVDVTVNNLLPGLFLTRPLQKHVSKTASAEAVSETEIQARLAHAIPLQRFGRTEEFGALIAFLCSPLAGFINGQNLLLDGGAFPGTF